MSEGFSVLSNIPDPNPMRIAIMVRMTRRLRFRKDEVGLVSAGGSSLYSVLHWMDASSMASSSLGHCNEVGFRLKGETFIVGEGGGGGYMGMRSESL